jgi:two-component system, chemotaxis family, sensor histidine kinase and response regulator PixL
MAAESHAGHTVLLIEDDFTTRECMSVLLAWGGYRVCVARNGAEALERLKTCELPELILLDLRMPVMNGKEFCKHRSESVQLSAIPLIVISGQPDADEQAAQLGAVGCIHKPVDTSDLLTQLKKYLPEKATA